MTTFNFRLGKTLAGGQALSFGAKIFKKDPRKPNILKFGIIQDSTIQLGDEVLYYDLDNTQVFGGEIQNIDDDTGVQFLEVADYSIQLSQNKINEIYPAGTAPEDIIEDIIDNYTDLTFVSSVSTGTTLDKKLVFKDEWLIDAIVKVLELFNGNYEVDINKNFTMTIMSSSLSTKDILYGRDKLNGSWKNDNQKKAEKVIVLGAIIDQRTTETLSGTGTVFNTTYKPENVQIAGLQQTTENIDGDFTVNVQNSEITFNSSKTDPDVSYTYKSQIRVELGVGKTVLLEKKYIESKSEARTLATEYKARFEDGAQSSKWLTVSSDIDSYIVGDLIYVEDDIHVKTGQYEIKSVTLTLPNRMVIEVGENEEDLFDQTKETIERIKQLEATNENSDFVNKYDYLTELIDISVVTNFTELQTIESTGEILFASETTLANDGDLISDTGADEDFALAYDDGWVPVRFWIDYLNPDRWPELITEDSLFSITTEDDFILVR